MMQALTRAELRDIVYTVLGEAAGEGNSGMAAVTHVILNRANDPRYPDSPAEVATQANRAGIHQFSAWNTKALGGNSPMVRYPVTSPTFRRAELVVKQVMAGGVPDYTYGATHYWSPNGMGGNDPYWATSESTAHGRVKIGGHVFLARKAVVPIPPPRSSGVAGAINEKQYLRRLALLPSVSAPVVKVNPPMPRPRPANIVLHNAVKRLPDISKTTMDLGSAPKMEELKSWQSKPAQPLTTRAVTTVAIDPVTGLPKSALQVAVERKAAEMARARTAPVKTALQIAVERKAAELATSRSMPAGTGRSAQAAIVSQRQEQEAQRRAVILKTAVTEEAARLAEKRTPPASNGRSAQSNITSAKAEQAVERQGQVLQAAVNRVAADLAAERRTTVKPPGGSASDRARAAQSPKHAAIPGTEVQLAELPPAPTYTTPRYGPNPVVKKEERLRPDLIASPLVDDIGAMPKFGDLSILRAKVAPFPHVRPVKVAPVPQRNAVLEAARLKQQQAVQRQVAEQARQVAVARVSSPAAAPVVRQQTAAVEYWREQGYSPSESYDNANRASVERAIANAANPDQARRLNQSLGNI